jgi:hypothetical protein
MKKLVIPLGALILTGWLSGCAQVTYQVQVNGYTDKNYPAQIAPGAGICIIENQEAKNPLLEKDIRDKIAGLLARQGYHLSPNEKADYYLLFTYGMGPPRSVTIPMPDFYQYGLGYYGSRSYLFISPYISYYPYFETVYDCFLLINVVDGKYYREQGQFRTLWVGEARSSGTSSDFRQSVDYLIAADLEQFGKNTGKAVTVDLNEQDPRIRELTR